MKEHAVLHNIVLQSISRIQQLPFVIGQVSHLCLWMPYCHTARLTLILKNSLKQGRLWNFVVDWRILQEFTTLLRPDIEKLLELVHQKKNLEPLTEAPHPFMQSLLWSYWLGVSKYAARTKQINNGYGAEADWNENARRCREDNFTWKRLILTN